MRKTRIYPIIQALVAAGLFGISVPLAKLLLGEMQKITLAALLYLGSGMGLLVYRGLRRIWSGSASGEARLNKNDAFWLIGAILTGGVSAPIVLMFSLQNTPAATASLLLNFEGVATTLIATFAFKETAGRRIGFAIIFITVASIMLSMKLGESWGVSFGALGVLCACTLWGIDNNFTRNISAKDPTAIVIIKGLCAGSFSLILAIFLGNSFPKWIVVVAALVLGCFSYGVSIALFVFSLRSLGAARTSALYGTSPFVGVVVSFLLFREAPDMLFLLSLPLMIVGVYLLFSEKHDHLHTHVAIEHDHVHRHGEHHIHEHAFKEISKREKHSHLHKHKPITHKHFHRPDIHHRHSHENTNQKTS